MLRPSALTRVSIATLATAICLGSAATAHAGIKVTDSAIIVDGAAGTGSADTTEKQPAQGGDESRLTEIVVTATKRETNLQKTPISIPVMAPEMI